MKIQNTSCLVAGELVNSRRLEAEGMGCNLTDYYYYFFTMGIVCYYSTSVLCTSRDISTSYRVIFCHSHWDYSRLFKRKDIRHPFPLPLSCATPWNCLLLRNLTDRSLRERRTISSDAGLAIFFFLASNSLHITSWFAKMRSLKSIARKKILMTYLRRLAVRTQEMLFWHRRFRTHKRKPYNLRAP